MSNTPVFMSIRDLGDRIRAGQFSPGELTKLFLNRLDKLGPRYNAVVTITEELALEQAEQAEKEIRSGRCRGPLHGIPFGAKDLLATSGGIPTSWGAAPFRDQVCETEASVIRKLRDAGAVLAAKLSMVELAGGMGYRQPNASFTGPGITPWDVSRWSGGSSSGSGSAVSAGLVPYAIGSETWGSILIPASHCGVTGLRPTYGRVSRYGAMALCWTLDKIGPLCLTADDCGLVLEAIAGEDPKDPTTARQAFHYDSDPWKRTFRLGIIENIAADADEAVRINFERAIEVLREVATFEAVRIPDLPYEAVTRTILFVEASSAFEDFIESGGTHELTAPEDHYTPYVRAAIPARDYIRAMRLRGIMAREFDRLMSRLDALVAPTHATPPTPLDRPFRSVAGGDVQDIMGAVGNGAGLPAVSVPNGFSDQGLPTGLQVMGRAYEENTVIAVARAYQSLTDWHRRHPPGLMI